MKFNRIVLVVVSLALMLFALRQPEEIKRSCYNNNVNGFSKRNRR